jgi:ribosomal protein S18 acetylase RimI-like enzyme
LVIRYRPFRNTDPPALAGLWNRGLPSLGVAVPLGAHEFDAMVVDKPTFDPAGLIVAEDEGGRAVGFVHAGFGPAGSGERPRAEDRELGSIVMLVVDPERDDEALERGLMDAAEAYLRGRGAAVIYAGGQAPVNPFYWGIYGGSECAGILSSHVPFHRAAQRSGYEPVANTVLLQADLAQPEPRDPKGVVLRRQTRLEVLDDAITDGWWESASLGPFRPTLYRLLARDGDRELARASTWEMAGFGRIDGRVHLGLHGVEVAPDARRQGYGRHLVGEVMRKARSQWNEVIDVQTRATNIPALALYESLGFIRVETATLYRKPG